LPIAHTPWHWPPLLQASVGLHAAAGGASLLTADAVPWALAGVVLNHVCLTLAGLWPKSRLLGPNISRLPEAALRALTTQVPQRHVALVALATTHDGLPQLLAEARYVVEDTGEAEFAVAVADAWQGQGLGRALVQRLAAHARAEGVPVLRGAVVPGNEPMLGLMGSLGAELQGHAAEVTVRLAL